jgi:hypothetical protein
MSQDTKMCSCGDPTTNSDGVCTLCRADEGLFKPVQTANCTLGVGNGDGKLFVHGDYESIKACQAIIIERDELRRKHLAMLNDLLWQPMAIAPKDGTMLRLLVQFTDNATEDSAGPCATIGANNFDHDQVDEWKFAGWNWTHDCFTEGVGVPIGWLPMFNTHPPKK